ncbi:MAG: ATP-binding protein [Bacteroidota bacterium]
MYYENIASPNISFQVIKSSDLPAKIISDEKKIFQVISYLLSNAVKFTKQGNITLHFQSEKTENRAKEVLITAKVTDTGKGIPKELRTRLFEPFSNLENNDARNSDGTGLSLAVCKKISSILNGDIFLDTQYTNGSRFQFIFQGYLPE